MSTSHTMSQPLTRVSQDPVHEILVTNQNGDYDFVSGDCYISKVLVNGNTTYTATPTTQISIWYVEGSYQKLLYGPLNIKTVDVSIGVAFHMATLLGSDLHIRGSKSGRLRIRIALANTWVQADAWGYRQATEAL